MIATSTRPPRRPRRIPPGVESTQWPDCYREHQACAAERFARLDAVAGVARDVVAGPPCSCDPDGPCAVRRLRTALAVLDGQELVRNHA